MNRQIGKMQRKLFELLISRTDIQLEDFPYARVFVTENEYNSLRSDVTPKANFRFGRNMVASIYIYHEHPYLIVPEVFEHISSTILIEVDDIKEIGCIYIVDNSICPNVNANKLELEEKIFVDESVQDIPWEQITSFFPGYTIFEINDTIPESSEDVQAYLKRVCIALICQTSDMLELPYDTQTLSDFMAIANSTDNNIPYDNIVSLRSATS